MSSDNVVLTEEAGGCPGHVVTGKTSKYQLEVKSGTHNITLRNAQMDEKYYAFGGEAARAGIAIRSGATANITLEGYNSASGYGVLADSRAGVVVESGASLVLDGAGTLVAWAGGDALSSGAAGIGGNYNSDFGNITISGGNVEAHGTGGGAGIGGGYKVGGGTATGDVTITGGFVQAFGGATGASSGAGIGAGENADYSGTITISGGAVRAIGGDEDQSSIGGGGTGLGSTNNGTFTTGENGNAVIVAPWGIGDKSKSGDWDCILLDREHDSQQGEQLVEYAVDDTGKETVTFVGGTPEVYGEVAADYNIVVNAPANLRVTTEINVDSNPDTPNNMPSTLIMKLGTTLTNNNAPTDPGIAGVALDPGSTLVLEDGTSQCLGTGKLLVTAADGKYGPGVVKLPLSDDMVSVSPTSYEYDGTAKEPAVTVAFNKWGFTQTFTEDVDYTLVYANNTNKGTATATATSKEGEGSKLLKTVGGVASTGTKGFEITEGDFEISVVSKRYVQKGEDELLAKLPSKPSFGGHNPSGVESGELKWFSDESCTVELTDGFVADKNAGDEVTVYWKYTQTGNQNCVSTKTGSTQLVITDQKPPEVQIDGSRDNILRDATYGDDAYTPVIQISTDDGNSWVDPSSDVTLEIESQEPVGKGDVIELNEGSISFVGAGDATVYAHVDGYTSDSPDGTGSYGPAFITISIHVSPAKVKVDADAVKAIDRAYNGTQVVEVVASLGEGIVGSDAKDGFIGVSATGKIDNRNAASDVPVTVTYELTGDKADDYALTNSPNTTVNITKAQAGEDTLQGKTGSLTVANGVEATYIFDLSLLQPDSRPVEGGVEGDGWYPGLISYENPVVNITDNRYFTADDIRIDAASRTMYLTVHDVDSTAEGELGTITFDMVCPNIEGMKGTIEVSRENASVYTVEASAGKGGSITPSGKISVVGGQDLGFAIAADEGYKIAEVLVDGKSVGAVGEYTFENVSADHTIEASFKKADDNEQGGGSGEGGDDHTGDAGDDHGNNGDGGNGNAGDHNGNDGNNGNGGGTSGEESEHASDAASSDASDDDSKLVETGDTFNVFAVAGVAILACGLIALGVVKKARGSC